MAVTLDISDAFNTAWSVSILRSLIRKEINQNIYLVLKDYLTNRKINSYGKEYKILAGCSQGSSLWPSLWLLIMENLFDNVRDTDDYKTQAFANDIIVLIKGISVKKSWGS